MTQFENTKFDISGNRIGPQHMKIVAVILLVRGNVFFLWKGHVQCFLSKMMLAAECGTKLLLAFRTNSKEVQNMKRKKALTK